MEFEKIIKDRCSVRKFSNKKVEEEKINKIVEAGILAPTACNKQPQRFIVLKTKEELDKLQKCKFSHFNEQLAIIVCYDSTLCWVREEDNHLSGEIDAAISATHMMLECTNLGLGSTWIMHYIPEAVREEFNLGDTIVPICILVIGYPDPSFIPSPMHGNRKNKEDFIL